MPMKWKFLALFRQSAFSPSLSAISPHNSARFQELRRDFTATRTSSATIVMEHAQSFGVDLVERAEDLWSELCCAPDSTLRFSDHRGATESSQRRVQYPTLTGRNKRLASSAAQPCTDVFAALTVALCCHSVWRHSCCRRA
jgi:hypothetical protein